MKAAVHAAAGGIAMITVAVFFAATVISELMFGAETIATVKHAIVWGLFLLIPALIMTGGSGFALARRRSGALVAEKRRRMPFIALNGLLVLLPAALFLDMKASAGAFDAAFYTVQGVELLFGAVQLWLLARSARAGIRLSRESAPAAAD